MADDSNNQARIEGAIDAVLGSANAEDKAERERIRGILGVLRDLPLEEPSPSMREWAAGLLAAKTAPAAPGLAERLGHWLAETVRSARALILEELRPDPGLAPIALRSASAPVRTYHGVAAPNDSGDHGERREAWIDLQAEPAGDGEMRVRGQVEHEPSIDTLALHVLDLDSGAHVTTVGVGTDGSFVFATTAARLALVVERAGDDRPIVVRDVFLKRR